jgi:hypothetical protein
VKAASSLARLILCLAVLIQVAACAKRVNWLEDVQLADGRVVTLERQQVLGGPHELFQPPTESVGWLEFKQPDIGRKVRWDFTRDLRPVALLIDHEKTQLLVVPEYDGRFKRHCPSPPYLLYEYSGSGWVERPIEELRGKKIRQNLISSPADLAELMKTNNLHLNPQQTARGADRYGKGRRIDFGKLTTQSFGMKGCDPPFNWLLEDDK